MCERNENIPVAEAVAHIQESHQGDASLQISPQELEVLLRNKPDLILLDVRTREEHEAVKLPGARLLTQELVQEIFTSGDKAQTVVLYDHTGSRSLDAAAYFIGNGSVSYTHLDVSKRQLSTRPAHYTAPRPA